MYVTTYEVAREAFWLKKVCCRTGVMSSDGTILYYDNRGTIALAKEPKFYQNF